MKCFHSFTFSTTLFESQNPHPILSSTSNWIPHFFCLFDPFYFNNLFISFFIYERVHPFQQDFYKGVICQSSSCFTSFLNRPQTQGFVLSYLQQPMPHEDNKWETKKVLCVYVSSEEKGRIKRCQNQLHTHARLS